MIGNNLLLAGTDEGYNLSRSLRFRSSASAYLNRTATAGNRKTWTWSGWVKRGLLNTSASGKFFGAGSSGVGNTGFQIGFGNESSNSDTIYMQQSTWGTSNALVLETNAVFRDPSAWYHVVLAVDTTQATDTNRVKLYVNGVQITSFNGPSYPSQNTDLLVNNSGTTQFLAAAAGYSGQRYFDGYLTEINFIDGQALTSSSFGETDTITGVWKPKRFAGTYGTNGFYLPFTDNSALTTSSNVGLGKDFSGNGNYWTTNNISITSGTTYDSMTDVPTLTSATAANFAVLNPLDKGSNNTLSNGNLQFQISSGTQGTVRSTFALPSTGKWYWEVTMTALGPLLTGIATSAASLTNYVGSDAYGWGYNSGDGLVYNNGTTIRANATLSAGDIVGVAFDSGAGSLSFYKNNVFQSTAITGFTPSTVNYFMAAGTNGGAGIVNFGQQPFAYTPPTGYVALNTYNLPTSTIVKGNTVMDATLYTGNGSTNTITNAAGFQPDFVWYKARALAYSHQLFDSVRGVTKRLVSNSTAAENTQANYLTSFNSNGFTIGNDAEGNTNASSYVAWQWQAGQGTTSSNTNGSITSTVSVNASAGFSVVTYTGTGANATVGHGLGVAPSLIIVKNRSASGNWFVYHSQIPATDYLQLNATAAQAASATVWNNTSPTSAVFSIGTGAAVNGSGNSMVAYCWSEIDGYSKFGKYTGNGSADGPFVYTGFRPKWVMAFKTAGGDGWVMYDTSRDSYNVEQNLLAAQSSNAESTLVALDGVSNGFKIRTTSSALNTSSSTYVYMAFAENPFKNALAR